MGMLPSWESLNDVIVDMQNRINDLEQQRKLFSTRSQTVPGTLSMTTAPQLNTWLGTASGSAVGPDIMSIPVYSGAILVVVTASITSGGGAGSSDTFYSYELEGATPVTPDINRALSVSWSPGADPAALAASYAFMHTGLTPGAYNLYSRYRVNSTGTTPLSGGSAKNRHILAIPF